MAVQRNPQKESSMISLTLQLIFERDGNVWNSIYDFEQDLTTFFKDNGLEVVNVASVDGAVGNRILLVKRLDPEMVLKNKKGSEVTSMNHKPSKQIVGGLTKELRASFSAQTPRGGVGKAVKA